MLSPEDELDSAARMMQLHEWDALPEAAQRMLVARERDADAQP